MIQEKIKLNIPLIKPSRKYWFVRTDGGFYRDDFIDGGFIGIGGETLLNFDTIRQCRVNKKYREDIRETLVEESITPKKAGKIIGQAMRFVCDMNIGDIVMIPSQNSATITFGQITSDVYLANDETTTSCPHKKRRNISWIKSIDRNALDPLLYRMLQAHQTISNCDKYAHQIDRTLNLLYIKDEKIHLTFMVEKQEDINWDDLFQLQKLLKEVLNLGSDITIKINVQSRGPIEFISNNYKKILCGLIGIQVFVGGGSMKIANLIEFELPGMLSIADQISSSLDSAAENKLQKDELRLKELEILNDAERIENEKLSIQNESLKIENESLRIEIEQAKYLEHVLDALKNLSPEEIELFSKAISNLQLSIPNIYDNIK